jgi:hypothetical protein
MSKVPGMRGTPLEYVSGIESRHNMSAEARSCGDHCKLPEGHPLSGDGSLPGGAGGRDDGRGTSYGEGMERLKHGKMPRDPGTSAARYGSGTPIPRDFGPLYGASASLDSASLPSSNRSVSARMGKSSKA